MRTFNYTKKEGGEQSTRSVFVISKASHLTKAIDLSEFTPDEQEYYDAQLTAIFKGVEGEIRELGLATCYRNFIEENISELV